MNNLKNNNDSKCIFLVFDGIKTTTGSVASEGDTNESMYEDNDHYEGLVDTRLPLEPTDMSKNSLILIHKMADSGELSLNFTLDENNHIHYIKKISFGSVTKSTEVYDLYILR